MSKHNKLQANRMAMLFACIIIIGIFISVLHFRVSKVGTGIRSPALIPNTVDRLVASSQQQAATKPDSKNGVNSNGAAGSDVGHQQGGGLQVADPTSSVNKHIRLIKHHDDTIFVSIASYRDVQCQPTIRDMFDKAIKPESLFIGAVEQHQTEDVMCMPPEYTTEECQLKPFCPSDNIKIRHIHPSKARGPTYGRYVGALMYSGQKYYMMIDSHNRFVTHWDAILLKMYRGLQADGVQKPVLSHYPEGWINPEVDPKGAKTQVLDNRPTTSYTCTARFMAEHGYLRLDGQTMARPKDGKPRPQPWAAAGFLFADAQVIEDCPFDPHLYYVFDGEEVMYSVRMWTHGWDIFSPSENIMYHDYGRKNAPKFWQYVVPEKRNSGHKRIQRFLKVVHKGTDNRIVPDDYKDDIVQAETEKYGLGTVRTLKQYWEYAEADPKSYTVGKKFCDMKAR